MFFRPGADRFPLVMTEIGVPRAGRDDQIVVGNAPLPDQHIARLGINGGHAAEQDGGVALAPQDAADRLRDVRRREARRRDLIEQRLEQMVVAPIVTLRRRPPMRAG